MDCLQIFLGFKLTIVNVSSSKFQQDNLESVGFMFVFHRNVPALIGMVISERNYYIVKFVTPTNFHMIH